MHVVVEVKKIIGTAILASILVVSPLCTVHAATSQDVTALKARITFLTAQVAKLQQQLLALQKKTIRNARSDAFYKTKFYTGAYEAVYFTDGDDLLPQKENFVRGDDQLLWDTFIEIAGESFADANISEFRVYNDTRSSVSAFVEEKPDQTWIVGFNREEEDVQDIYKDEGTVELFLHEYAHIIFFENERIANEFKDEFWNGKKKAVYAASKFVSEYAATSPDEDLAESFVEFVTGTKPETSGEKYDKIRFFYDHASMVNLRTTLRKSDLI